MLTRELAIAEYDWDGRVVVPDRLSRGSHHQYRDYAARMLKVYTDGANRTRRELHRDVHQVFAQEEACPLRRIDSFCKLLDEVSEFDKRSSREAAGLRQKVFRLAASHHPLVERPDKLFDSNVMQVRKQISKQLNLSWPEIERNLFADVIEFQRLSRFHGYDSPEALLARYNVAQLQATLFDALQMTVWASRDFKLIVRSAKLARLMHSITRLPDGRYKTVLDGPASILGETRRYGVAMARFLPSLLGCRDWAMHAKIQHRRSSSVFALRLNSDEGIHSDVNHQLDYDSSVEQSFAEKWGEGPREGWRLIREDELLCRGQKVFVPDFVLQHDSGRRLLLEIVGFWTPEYLSAKVATLRAFSEEMILLAVSDSVRHAIPSDLDLPTVVFKNSLAVMSVVRLANQMVADANEAR